MIRFFSLLLKIICFLFVFSHAGYAKLEVVWIDVGQGDACFSKVSKPNSRVPALIVDSGSSKNTSGRKSTIKENILQTLHSFFSVETFLEKREDDLPDLYVIVTHGDEDHLYFVVDIVNELEKQQGQSLDIRFILGGKKDDFCKKNAEGLKFFNYVQHRSSQPSYRHGKFLVEEMNPPLTELKFDDTTSLTILSALSGEDKNTNSIVSRLVHGMTSLVFTGDATTTTVETVKENPDFKAPSTLLQLSHHGSSTHGSNSKEWLQLVRANYFVCSSSMTPYNHPHGGVIENFFQTTPPCLKEFYLVKFSESREVFLNFERWQGALVPLGKDKDYMYAAIKMPFFSTLVYGNLNFIFDDKGILESSPLIKKGHPAVTPQIPISHPLSIQKVLPYYMSTPDLETVILDNFDFEILTNTKIELLRTQKLKRLFLRGNLLGEDQTHLDFVKEIMRNLLLLETFNLTDNNFSISEKKEAQEVWGHFRLGLLF